MYFLKLFSIVVVCGLSIALSASSRVAATVDSLDNWNRTVGHSSGLVLDGSNPSQFLGDKSRAKRLGNSLESFYYHEPNARQASAIVYWTGRWANSVQLMTSVDGVHWKAVKSAPAGKRSTSNGWFKATVTSTLPMGTNFVKFNIANDPLAYSPQIGQVSLTCAR
jgi:hypothetical protein